MGNLTDGLRGFDEFMPRWNERCGNNPSINEILDAIDANYNPSPGGGNEVYVTVGFANTDYVCDGTDDNVELQQAIDYVIANGGGTIYVKPGDYYISERLLIVASGIIFKGAGAGATIFHLNNEVNQEIIVVGDAVTPCNNVSLLNFSLDGNKANQTASSLYAGGTRNLIRYRADSQNCYGALVEGVHAYNGKQNGLSSESEAFVTFQNNVIDNCDNFGIWFENGSNMVFAHNFTRNNGAGIKGLDASGVSILGHDSKGDKTAGIALQSIGESTLTGSVVYRAGWQGGDPGINANGIGLSFCSSVAVVGNTIYAAYANGLEMYDTNKCIVQGNTFKRNGQYANNTFSDIHMNTVGGTRCNDNIFTNNTFNNETAAFYTNKVKYNISANAGNSHQRNIIANNNFGAPATGFTDRLASDDGTPLAEDNVFGFNTNMNPSGYYNYGYLIGDGSGPNYFDLDWQKGDFLIGTGYTATVTIRIRAGLYRGQKVTFRFGQDVGNKLLNWASNIKFAGNRSPILSTTASAADTLSFVWDGNNWVEYARSIQDNPLQAKRYYYGFFDATVTLDLSLGNFLVGYGYYSSTTVAIQNGRYVGEEITFQFLQGPGGNKTISWGANIKFTGSGAPVLATAENDFDLFRFIWDGTNWYAKK